MWCLEEAGAQMFLLVTGQLTDKSNSNIAEIDILYIDVSALGAGANFGTDVLGDKKKGVGKMRNCGMRNAESKMRNGPCGMHLIG